MIVVIAMAVVSVFLHTERDARKMAISRKLGKKRFSARGWGTLSSETQVFFSWPYQIIRARNHKRLVTIANRETLIRLLSQKQSDLGLHCLSRLFGR